MSGSILIPLTWSKLTIFNLPIFGPVSLWQWYVFLIKISPILEKSIKCKANMRKIKNLKPNTHTYNNINVDIQKIEILKLKITTNSILNQHYPTDIWPHNVQAARCVWMETWMQIHVSGISSLLSCMLGIPFQWKTPKGESPLLSKLDALYWVVIQTSQWG